MQSFKETTSTTLAAHGSELLRRRIKRRILLPGLWLTPVICLVGVLSVNVLTERFGWQTHLVLLAAGALVGLLALAARRVFLSPRGKAALGFVGMVLLLGWWIAPELGLLALGTVGTVGVLLSMSWLFKQLWGKVTALIKNKEVVRSDGSLTRTIRESTKYR